MPFRDKFILQIKKNNKMQKLQDIYNDGEEEVVVYYL